MFIMAIDHDFTIEGHPSIYEPQRRRLKIYFSEPQNGVNNETGLLLFIPGFGGNANSNVYQKMRSQFADRYNLVTLQCDYFGWEYMQEATEFTFNFSRHEFETILTPKELDEIFEKGTLNIQKFLQIVSKYHTTVYFQAKMNEDLTNFNDMGIMQALDNLDAVLAIIEVLKENQLSFNQGKIMIYGHSHGAYLSYLCNAFAPRLFSLIIDNSAWLYPHYLTNRRVLYYQEGNATFAIIFNYLGKKFFENKELVSLKELLFLPYLYNQFTNNCKILTYHGTTDNLITHKEKENFCRGINNCIYTEISNKNIDGIIFKSTDHGLDADFLALFNQAYTTNSLTFDSNKNIKSSFIQYRINDGFFSINYDNGLPVISWEKKTTE